MKDKLLKSLSTLLSILFIIEILPMSVWGADYSEGQEAKEYFDKNLSTYLSNIVDTKGAVNIKEKELLAKCSTDEESLDLSRLTLNLKDGAETSYLFSEPIAFIDNEGVLAYKDTNIIETKDEKLLSNGFSYENGVNDYKIYFSNDSVKGVLISTPSKEQIKLSLKKSFKGSIQKVKIDGIVTDGFVYDNAFGEDSKLSFYPQLNGVKDEIEIAKFTGQNKFELTLDTGKNTAAINCFGEVEIINPETKEIVETFSAPFAMDALKEQDETSKHYSTCKYDLTEVKDGKYQLTIIVPIEFLESKDTVYPVTIDPTTSNLNTTYDTAVYSGVSTSPQSANASACVGKTSDSNYGYGRALFKFSIPSDIQNYASISSAKFWVRETTARTDTAYVRPYVIKDSWNNSTTWSTKPSYYNGTATYLGSSAYNLARRNINSTSTDNPNSHYWYAFDITNAVRSWKTGTANHGIILVSEYESSSAEYHWRAFATKENGTSSYRPYAVITYTNDTTAPTISSVSGNPTSYTNANVTLTVNATDNVYGTAGVAGYSFDNGSTWQTSNTKTFSSNQTVNIKVKDKAGNISAVKTVTISKIDKTKPSATITLSPSGDTYGIVTASITMTDNASLKNYSLNGATAVSISGTSKTLSKTFSTNGTVSIKVTDTAGNTNTITKSFSNILLPNSDVTAPAAPTIYEENGQICVSSNSINFNENTEAPETVQYKIGSGSWTEYTEPLNMVNTAGVTIYARVIDAAGNSSENSSITKKANVGIYENSFDDISSTNNLMPVGLSRHYSSNKGWFFSFNANISTITNGYKYIDFSGEEHYYILDEEGKYMCSDGSELKVESGTAHGMAYTKYIEDGSLKIYFGSNNKLACVDNDGLYSTYTWYTQSVYIRDKDSGLLRVDFTDGNPTLARYTRNTSTKSVSYTWNNSELVGFTDVLGNSTTYSYTNGLLTSVGSTSIDYTNGANPRVKRVTNADGSFVKYTYNDSHASSNTSTPNNIGAVTIEDSKGVSDVAFYSDSCGFSTSGNAGGYSDDAIYAPTSISNALTTDTISSVYYIIQEPESDEISVSEEVLKFESQVHATETYTKQSSNFDGTFTIDYFYSANDQLFKSIVVPASAITNETGSEIDAETVGTTKINYSYDSTFTDSLQSYSVSTNNGGIWFQTYSENYVYDNFGNVTSKTVINTEYTTNSNNSVEASDSYDTTNYTYDTWGNCTEIVYHYNSENEETVSTTFDAKDRQISYTAGNTTFTTIYDANDNVTSYTDTSGTTTYTYSNNQLVSRTNPDNTTASYIYDNFGNLTDHSYNGYSFTYNTLGNIVTANAGSQNLVTYTYSADTKQNLLSAAYGNGQTLNYTYSDDGVQSVSLDNTTKFNYSYTNNTDGEVSSYSITDVNNIIKSIDNSNDNFSRTTVSNGNTQLYAVENHSKSDEVAGSYNGTLVSIENNTYVVKSDDYSDHFEKNNTTEFNKSYTKDSQGNVIISSTGNAIETEFGYTADGNINLIDNKLSGTELQSTYGYDNNGNVTSETVLTKTSDSVGATLQTTISTNYTYDNKNQLISAENDTTKWTYTYDDRGNILERKEYWVSVNADGSRDYYLANTDTFGYDSVWEDKLVSYCGDTLQYDNSGNWTHINNDLILHWTMGRQLAAIAIGDDYVSYTYNEDGIRTSKTYNGVTTNYYLNGSNVIYQNDGTNELYFFYDQNEELVGFNYNNNNYFYVKNALGVITDIVDSNGNIVSSYSYDPWGAVLSVSGDTTIGDLNPFRYKSYYYDEEVEWYYLQSRYYYPTLCRFINCDDVNYIGATESELSYNPFAYCENEPLINVDYTGTFSVAVSLALGAFIGVITLYLIDVIINLYKKVSRWWTRRSTITDYFFAAINGAVSTLNLKKISIFIAVMLSSMNYIGNCMEENKRISFLEWGIRIVIAVICSIIAGDGINLKNRIGVIKNSKIKLVTAISKNRINLYKDKIIANTKGVIINTVRSFAGMILSRLTSNLPSYAINKVRLILC